MSRVARTNLVFPTIVLPFFRNIHFKKFTTAVGIKRDKTLFIAKIRNLVVKKYVFGSRK